jgi:hypothetical protein
VSADSISDAFSAFELYLFRAERPPEMPGRPGCSIVARSPCLPPPPRRGRMPEAGRLYARSGVKKDARAAVETMVVRPKGEVKR